MKGWKSGRGLVRDPDGPQSPSVTSSMAARARAKMRKPTPPSRAPRHRHPPPRPFGSSAANDSRGRKSGEDSVNRNIDTLERKMRECAAAQDFVGAVKYQKQLEEAKKERDLQEARSRGPSPDDLRRRSAVATKNIKDKMKPFIQSKKFQKCIPLREDLVRLQNAIEMLEGDGDGDAIRRRIASILEKHGA